MPDGRNSEPPLSLQPSRAGAVLVPGVPTLGLGVERYVAEGGAATVFSLEPGDGLTVRDREGRQPAQIAAFAPDGSPDTEALGVAANGSAEGLKSVLGAGDERSRSLSGSLQRRGLDIAGARSVDVLGGESRAGDEASFTAERPLVCFVAAPGGPMRVDRQDPPTPVEIFVARANPVVPDEHPVPEPLADPRIDRRIAARTAEAYEVKAGEFIQIIDVQGRECSDFQAFTVAGLDAGQEFCLDATATRTLMGSAYPAPGLLSKCYDVNLQPMVEVIRDTCGRHDSFLYACTAKYYDDMGYPGHVNCTDNFNGALAPFGIAPRRGWMALNFFFNTGFEADQAVFDNPWSRPGDYVLMQALTDLVCVSSACPDDIDAANGWNPTDIHVRVYPRENVFSKAVAYRMTPDADPKLTRETGFHGRFAEHTRNFIEYNGYWLASDFTNRGALDEYWACRERAAIMDLSPLRKFEVLGPDAERLLQWVLTRNIRRLATGQVVYSAMCYETGGMIDDGTAFRLGDDNFRWVGGCDYGGEWMREQAAKLGLNVWVRSSTDQLHNVAVQGPGSRDILKQVVWTPPVQPSIEELGWFRFAIGRIGDPDGIPIVVSRTGYTGELGFEVWCHPRHATGVWDAIWQAGEPEGLSPFGLEALDMVRIEAGLIFAGYEFDDQTDPFEAGIGFTVPLKSKEDDFVGREALIRRKDAPQRKLVGLELEGQEAAAHGDCVHVGRAQVGVVTSGMRSPILRKNIALCRMDTTASAEGTAVEVGKLDGHQKRIPAKVVPFPFYDPTKSRVKA
ncbi:MAG: DUF1989 domain-containing protein [Defluviicoccus sp.]|nr:DUF1989 domain-containing protein [Defluviicoccus sp.]MDE0384737.1 DUF1989 domain-containing protein [Defluviicoccus sp.]